MATDAPRSRFNARERPDVPLSWATDSAALEEVRSSSVRVLTVDLPARIDNCLCLVNADTDVHSRLVASKAELARVYWQDCTSTDTGQSLLHAEADPAARSLHSLACWKAAHMQPAAAGHQVAHFVHLAKYLYNSLAVGSHWETTDNGTHAYIAILRLMLVGMLLHIGAQEVPEVRIASRP